MLNAERAEIAGIAIKEFVGMQGMRGIADVTYLDAVRSKTILALRVIDDAADSINRPLLVKNVVPGYDVMVFKSQEPKQPAPLEVPVEAATGVDPRHLDALGLILDRHFSVSFENKTPGALIYESEDGMRYVLWPAVKREVVMKLLGFAVDEMLAGGERRTVGTVH